MNQSFADTIQDVYKEGDIIWVHDYHLTMLPQMLRNVLPSAKIGFFLHLPFPSSEVGGGGGGGGEFGDGRGFGGELMAFMVMVVVDALWLLWCWCGFLQWL